MEGVTRCQECVRKVLIGGRKVLLGIMKELNVVIMVLIGGREIVLGVKVYLGVRKV